MAYHGTRCRQPAIAHFRRNVNAVRLIHRPSLGHHRLAECSQAGFGCDAVKCCMSEGAYWIETYIAPQLKPDIPSDIFTNRRVEAGSGQYFAEYPDAA